MDITAIEGALLDLAGRFGSFVVHLFQLGGVVVWLLLVTLVWCLGIVVWKLGQLRHHRVINARVIAQIERLLLDNKLAEATAYCKKVSLPMTRIILGGSTMIAANTKSRNGWRRRGARKSRGCGHT